MKNATQKEIVVEQILKECISFQTSKNKESSDLIATLILISANEDVCRSYPEISHIIYDLKHDDFEALSVFFGINNSENSYPFEDLRQQEKLDSLDKKRKGNLNRFERHVELSCYQRKYIKNITAAAKKEADEAEKIATKAQDKVQNIYSEFVGILAIFTAMSFAMMGSVQILGNLFNKISRPYTGSIGYALVVGGIYLIIIFLLIVAMFLGIKGIFGEVNEKNRNSNKKFQVCLICTAGSFIIIGLIVLLAFHIIK